MIHYKHIGYFYILFIGFATVQYLRLPAVGVYFVNSSLSPYK